MKHLTLIALLLSSTFIHAEESKVTNLEYCTRFGELAEVIMKTRQNNRPMSGLLKVLEYMNDKTINNMVIMAYDEPAYYTEELKNDKVKRFRNKAFKECYPALSNNILNINEVSIY